MTTFSIIVPTYNSAATLNACIDSLLAQTFSGYEVIFIDGGSQDGTLEIIGSSIKAARDIAGFQLVSEPDNGIYDAMNKGIKLAKGQWLYFLGSDDELQSSAVLEKVWSSIQKDPVDLIYGNVTGTPSKTKYANGTVSKVLSCGIHHQGIFYNRIIFNIFPKYNLRYKIAADYHLTIQAFLDSSIKTRYIDLDIALCGENGLSGREYDYTFYSYHYRLLAKNNGLKKIENAKKCLDDSVHCCLQLVIKRENRLFAWQNLIYYVTQGKNMTLFNRFRSLYHIILWSLRSMS